MRADKLNGKTIARVVQKRRKFNSGMASVIEAVQFTDGTWLRFSVRESPDCCEYGVEPIYPAREA